jgi:hypothetical protein
MWVQRSSEEIATAKQKVFKDHLWTGLILGGIAGLFVGFGYNRMTGSFAAGPTDITRVIFSVVGMGLVFGIPYAFFQARSNNTWICPSCEQTKRPDATPQCPCGGSFQDMLSVKWVEDESEDLAEPGPPNS